MILAMLQLFALHESGGGIEWTVGNIIVTVTVIVIVALIGVALVVCRVAGIDVPQWVWSILGICLVAFVAILAVRFLLSL